MNLIVDGLFHFDALAQLMTALIGFIFLNIVFFSKRYMLGDRNYNLFFLKISALFLSLIAMVSADHIVLFLFSWIMSNLIIVELMVHNSHWRAAKNSGVLARNNFMCGFAFLSIASILLVWQSGSYSIQTIISVSDHNSIYPLALLFITFAAMAQSAIWPFHKWLLSSLNSPTPVSSLMHAGIVNGGGFLIVRFFPIFNSDNQVLLLLAVFGLISSILGTLIKLIQNDVKKMLAASTMAQMGFMFLQLGLGLFISAICHLVWHGMFKAYLFLASGGAAHEKTKELPGSPKAGVFILSITCGVISSYFFAYAIDKNFIVNDTTIFLYVVTFIMSTQVSLSILGNHPLKKFPLALTLTTFLSGFYAFNISVIEIFLSPVVINHPHPLSSIHGIILFLMLTAYLVNLFPGVLHATLKTEWQHKLYVYFMNLGLPHRKTVTANRNDYRN